MRKVISVITAVGFILVLTLSFVAAESGRQMTVTYKDGKKQSVQLDESSTQIIKIEFTDGEQAVPQVSFFPGGKEYQDSKGAKVFLPCGRLAFADRVVSYKVGNPAPVDKRAMMPDLSVLGEPDYISEEDELRRPYFSAVTLGCGGSIILEFTKVRIVDIPGPDIYVFEVGPAIEPTQLEISKDGYSWINIGKISGGKASVDIHGFVAPGDQFRFVRLTDLRSACGGNYPGADIDAVAAIGCVKVQD